MVQEEGISGRIKEWNPTSETDSYGHDIEASWLIVEAARLLKDPKLIAATEKLRYFYLLIFFGLVPFLQCSSIFSRVTFFVSGI